MWGVHLEVRAGDTGCDLFEEWLLDPDELRRLDHVQDLLDFPQEHHLDAHDNTHVFYLRRTKQRHPKGSQNYIFKELSVA